MVGGVEVSVDGGATWHPARRARRAGRYAWTPGAAGTVTIQSPRRRRQRQPRDRRGRRHGRPSRRAAAPASIWDDARTPARRQTTTRSAVELGVKFRSDVDGFDHRAPLLQERRQHRHARRAPVDGRRHAARRRRRSPARPRSGWQQVDLRRAGRDHRRTRPTSPRTTRRTGYYAVDRRLLRQRGVDNAAAARAARRRRRRRTASTATAPTAASRPDTFDVEQLLGRRRLRRRRSGPTRRRRRSSQRSPATGAIGRRRRRQRHGDVQRADGRRRRSTARPSSCATPSNALVAGDGHLRRRDAHGDRSTPTRPAAPTRPPTRRRSRAAPAASTDVAGNALAADSTWSFTTAGAAAAAARRGPGRADPRDRERREPVQPLLRRDPARRRPERVHASPTSRNVDAGRARRATTSSILGEMRAERRAGRRCSPTGCSGGGNLIAMRPDTQLAGLLGLTDAGGTLAERLPAGRHRRRRPARASSARRSSSTAPPTATRSNGATDGRDALLERRPRRPRTRRSRCAASARTAARRRRSPTTSRARSSTRARATRRGPARSATASRRSAPTTCSSAPRRATRSPTGSTSNKVAIPQADEQQRLLANLIVHDEPRPQAAAALLVPPARREGGVVMTGDDHGNGGTAGRFDDLPRAEPAGLLGRRLGVRPRHVLHLPEHAASPTRRPPPTTAQGFEVGAARQRPTAPTGRRRRSSDFYASQLADVRARSYPSVPAPTTNRTHCIAWSDWATQPKVELAQRHPPRHELLLLAGGVGAGPARAVHRLGHADALRRPRRLDDRRLPGGDADDRRVGPDLPVHDRHAARQRARRRRATTASSPPTCTPTAPTHAGLGRDRRLGAGARRAGRLGAADADLARRPQRLVVRRRSPGTANTLDFTIAVGAGRERPAGDGADAARRSAPLTASRATASPVADDHADDQGRRVRVLRRRRPAATRRPTRSTTTAPAISDVAAAAAARRHRDDHLDDRRGVATRASTTAPAPGSLDLDVRATPRWSTSHSVQLTGLAPNTTYYYRVTSADAAATPPPSPSAARPRAASRRRPPAFTDTTVADFGAGHHRRRHLRRRDRRRRGHPDADRGRRSSRADPAAGRLVEPDLGDPGRRTAAAPPSRAAHCTSTAPAPAPTRPSAPGRSLEFVATFGGASFQHVGFGVDFNSARGRCSAPRASGSRSTPAPTTAAVPTDTPLAAQPASARRTASGSSGTRAEVRYYVDGSLVAHPRRHLRRRPMRPLASDFNAGGPDVSVDWLRMSPYPASGTFDSRVFDAGQAGRLGRARAGRADTPARHRRRAQRPHRQHPDPRRELERLHPGRSTGDDDPAATPATSSTAPS